MLMEAVVGRENMWRALKRVLKLIRGYLQAGVLDGGPAMQRTRGTPQGGPLSPSLESEVFGVRCDVSPKAASQSGPGERQAFQGRA